MTNPCRTGKPFNSHNRGSQRLLVMLLLATAMAGADRALAEGTRSEGNSVEFSIPAQSVPAALSEFARQARVQLFFISDGFESIQANPVAGRYAIQQALDLLLDGTGLAADYSSAYGVKVKPVRASVESLMPESQRFATAIAGTRDGRHELGPDESQAERDVRNGDSNRPHKPALPIEEILVTGSNIRGIKAVGADVITLDRAYIEMSGIASTTELIQSVPQNFGLGNEAVAAVGVIDNTGTNWGFASGVDLRGLGTDSTLVLLNGRRSAGSGSAGNFVDLNTIPTVAIERIDVLPDGASAIYGSDAVGGVVNVILRDDYEGAESRVRYAPGTSDIDEFQLSHVFGRKWGGGRVLFSYEYYDRSELKAADRIYTGDSDLTSLGGSDGSTSQSNPANILSPLTFLPAFSIPAGQDGTALVPADLIDLSQNPDAINLQNAREGSYTLPEQKRNSVFVFASQTLSDNIDVFAEARYSKRNFEFLNSVPGRLLAVPSTNPFFVDPFGGSSGLFLLYNMVDDYGATRSSGDVEALGGVLGATFGFGDSWELEAYGSFGSESTFNTADRFPNSALLAAALADPDPSTAFNPFGDGSNTNPATLAAIKGFADVNVESELSTLNVRIAGDTFDLPGGAARVALGYQFRDQSLSSENIFFVNTPEPVAGFAGDIFDLDRRVTAAFAEVYLPLMSDQNARRGVKNLALSIAGRYEDYSDFGDTFDPKLGVMWSPVKGINLRSTIGTSFRAPLLTELNVANNRILLRNLLDPNSPTGETATLLLLGTSPGLVPQEGTTWTAGFDLAPEFLPEFQLGLTYFDTSVDNIIQLPISAGTARVFFDPIANAPVITHCPCDAATVAELFNDPSFGDSPIPPDQLGAIVDGRVQNVAEAELSGLDLDVAYAFETAVGRYTLSLYASHLFEFRQQLLDGPSIDNVDKIAKPNSLNVRGSVSWEKGGVTAVLVGKHIGDYTNDIGSIACNENPCAVSSWTTWDLQLGYDFGDQLPSVLGGTQLSLSVQNVLDTDPPFVDIVDIADAAVGFDAINANPFGRFAAIQLTKTW